MIYALKNIEPFISYGLGMMEYTAEVSEAVTIWMGTLYNQAEYDTEVFISDPVKGTVVTISPYQHTISFTGPGTYEVFITVTDKAKTKALNSNTLTLIVI